MDKYQFSESDICTKFTTPVIQQAGWQGDALANSDQTNAMEEIFE